MAGARGAAADALSAGEENAKTATEKESTLVRLCAQRDDGG